MSSTTGSTNAPGILAQALWFGLLTGLAEASLTGVKRLVLGRIVRVGPDIAWMAPVADGLAFLVIGLVLVALARLWKSIDRHAMATGVLAFLAFFSVLLMYYPLHLYAKVLLAAGLAVQAARLALKWPAVFQRVVRGGVLAMAVLVVLLAAATQVRPSRAYRQHVNSLPAAPAGGPNVLLVVWDTVRADNLSLYGYARATTPQLDRWAKSGAVFERAMATSPWTLPSHASMFTGQWPQQLSANWEQPLDAGPRTLAEVLAARGYLTAGFVANTYYCGNELGIARGFAHYEDYVVSPREVLISSTLVRLLANSYFVRRVIGYHDNIPRRSAADITDQFLRWHSPDSGRPFFAFLNYFDAHENYLPPAPFDRAFGDGPLPGSPAVIQDVRRSLRRDWPQWPASEIQAEVSLYDGAIAYLDDQLNRLLGELQARGVLDNTIVIVTSDHGEQFGEHGLFLHANSLYRPLLHVPLVIRYPRAVPAGQRIARPVSLRDLPATVLDFLDVDEGALPGATLARHWTPAERRTSNDELRTSTGADAVAAEVREASWAKMWSPWYPAAKGDMQSITDEAFHYIRNGDGTEELYAESDPGERRNLAGLPEGLAILERYRALLRATVGGRANK
jgi:arylsulfatase A-like enzyme/chromate transport protein ChrA